jgi:DNA-binding HxlR family transcriptional regulator
MSVNETVEQPPPRPRRPDRRHGRLEDFEMIERTRAALTLLDSKWSVPVIVLLASGVRRHARLMDNIPGISKKVLSATLRKLEHHGLVARDVYAEIPVRVEYRLTPLGWRLTEPLMAFDAWARRHQLELAHPVESDRTPHDGALATRATLVPVAAA